jgi:HSP20 family protein
MTRREESIVLLRFDPFREIDQSFSLPRPVTMPLDAYRDGNRFIVAVDIPGLASDSIELTVEKNVLTIRAERKFDPEEGQETIIAERPHGSFSRELFLGDTLVADKIEADYDLGVLTLTIPIAEQDQPHRVPVTAGHAMGNGGGGGNSSQG